MFHVVIQLLFLWRNLHLRIEMGLNSICIFKFNLISDNSAKLSHNWLTSVEDNVIHQEWF